MKPELKPGLGIVSDIIVTEYGLARLSAGVGCIGLISDDGQHEIRRKVYRGFKDLEKARMFLISMKIEP